MKNLILVLGLVLSVFFNACQENSITDPITNNNLEKNASYYVNLGNGKIKLDEELLDTSQNPSSTFNIMGIIDYSIIKVRNQSNADQYYNTIVKLKIDAKLKPSLFPLDRSVHYPSSYLIVKKATEDYLNISFVGAREFKIIKKYETTEGNNHLKLVCTFAVMTNQIILKEMHLCCDRQVQNLITD